MCLSHIHTCIFRDSFGKNQTNFADLTEQHHVYTVEPPNNGHVWDEHFVHCSEVVPSSEVEMYGQYIGRG